MKEWAINECCIIEILVVSKGKDGQNYVYNCIFALKNGYLSTCV